MKRFTLHASGFTIIELTLYVVLLAALIGAMAAFLSFTLKSQAKTKAQTEIAFQTQRVVDVMSRDVREAENVYKATSVFASSPGQLSLKTKNNVPQGHSVSYIDFFVCGQQICRKREGGIPTAITSSTVRVDNLVFRHVVSGVYSSLRVELTLSHGASSAPSMFTISLRPYESR